MKISCPGCGRTYAVPQNLIDQILKEHQPKTSAADQDFFRQVPQQPAPALAPRRSRIKIAMLVVTVLWPIAIAFFTTDLTFHAMAISPEANRSVVFAEKLVSQGILWTLAWGVAMAFLLALWFATRR